MNLKELRQTAFAKWLSTQSQLDQVSHMFECLKKSNSSDNMAWDLMIAVHGDNFEITGKTILQALIELHEI